MKNIFFDPDARSEFLESVSYYEECRVGLGHCFRDVVELAVQSISETPFRYRVLQAPFRRCVLQKFPYAIIYSIEPDHIRIIAIMHTKRKPEYWVERT